MSKNLKGIEREIKKSLGKEIYCSEWHSSIVLEGEVKQWSEVILAGKLAANKGYKGVINKIKVKGLELPQIKRPLIKDKALEGKMVDVLIIGGGIIGSSIARELSKWDTSILLIDKEEDLAMHTSSRNDGMVHPGIEAKPGSKRAVFNVRGNELYSKVTEELDVHFERCGSNWLFDKRWVKAAKPFIMARARKSGVKGISFLSKEEMKKLEPNIIDDFQFAIHFETTGILSPYKMTIAYGENAVENGAEVSLNTIVMSMEKEKDKIISVTTNRGKIYPKTVINAAGVFADEIANMAGDQFFTIHPRKGHIIFLDKKKGQLINSVIAKPPINLVKGNTKGGGIVKTIDGNVLIGPDAYEQPFKEDYSTSRENIDAILRRHLPLVSKFSPADVITYCAGNRAATYEEDFIIERSEYVNNLIHAAGIQSPGLASAPAIAEEVEKITCKVLSEGIQVKRKENWNPRRKSIPDLSKMTLEERSKLIKKNPDYGIIICRCEEVSKGEIEDALRSPIPVSTVDGIKRRVRAGMGRCQGGFCMPLVMDVIAKETGKDMKTITKKGRFSNILNSEVQEEYKKAANSCDCPGNGGEDGGSHE